MQTTRNCRLGWRSGTRDGDLMLVTVLVTQIVLFLLEHLFVPLLKVMHSYLHHDV